MRTHDWLISLFAFGGGTVWVPPPGILAIAAASGPQTAVVDSSRHRIRENAVVDTVAAIEVIGSYDASRARRSAASQGLVAPKQLALRPLLRAGDVLESVPGLLISQHSGEGKANQYYLRGFNLDHGTDFATMIAGVPVNMPTNAHGQGYTDLNFVIPELISGIQYTKGTYSAEDGDFSSAGSARISYRDGLERPIASVSPGDEGYRRVLVGASPRLWSGTMLGSIELLRNDGPWVHPDEYQKINGLLRYSTGSASRGLSVTAAGYDGRWNATDQVPERAVASGRISRFGAIDPTDGGTTHRYSLSAEFQQTAPRAFTQASAYVIAYRLDLFSDFTYFLRDSVHGDQFEQADARVVTGLHLSHEITTGSSGREVQQKIGVDVRNDDIARVGLYDTEARRRLETVREDHIVEQSLSPFVQSDARLLPRLRTSLGVRADVYRFTVASGYQVFSGSDVAALVSPKASVVLGPWGAFDVYLNGGYGFHSDDVRGARFTPRDASQGVQGAAEHFPIPGGPPIERSPLLVRTKGAELGARLTGDFPWSAATSLWGLEMASESVFLGDANLTAPSRPSLRTGIELSGEGRPVDRVHVDADLAYSRARFRDHEPVGDHIPGAVEGVISASIAYQHPSGEFAELRLRYFGPRPLTEDNAVRSHASTVLNTQLGYRVHGRWTVALQVFNLLDRAVSDVDYYYTSRLPREPAAGIADVHAHPQAPRSIRLTLSTGVLP
jgi:TonB dependent receptor/TonB-dependent Receptor Plug Domain